MKKAEAKAFVEGYLDVVKAYVLKGAKVKIGDIGMVMIRHRKARMGRNPQTGEPVKIKASKKLAFRQSAVMKAAVMGGR
jgi:DNA-binding protein HU-beta